MLEHAGYPQDAVDELIAQAVATGERDDITAVVMELPTVLADLPGDTPAASAQPAAAAQAPAHKSSKATAALLLTALTILVLFALYWMLR